MREGKPAGIRCVQLTDDNHCRIFGHAERPPVCLSLQAHEEMCGSGSKEALDILTRWELLTKPD
jgi:hypothetical protein